MEAGGSNPLQDPVSRGGAEGGDGDTRGIVGNGEGGQGDVKGTGGGTRDRHVGVRSVCVLCPPAPPHNHRRVTRQPGGADGRHDVRRLRHRHRGHVGSALQEGRGKAGRGVSLKRGLGVTRGVLASIEAGWGRLKGMWGDLEGLWGDLKRVGVTETGLGGGTCRGLRSFKGSWGLLKGL